MPAPPPKVVSSTERCGSVAADRRSWTRTSTTSARRARPIRLASSHPLTRSGKMVKTSIRIDQAGRKVHCDLSVRLLDDESQRDQHPRIQDQEVAGGIGLDCVDDAVPGSI